MQTVNLGINYCNELFALRQEQVDFQYIKIGDWHEQNITTAMNLFPDKVFLFHKNSLIRPNKAEAQALIATLQAEQQQTGSPWLSAHLNYYTDEEILALVQEGRRPPHYHAEEAFDLVVQAVQTVQKQLPVPLLLENMPHWHIPEIDLAALPAFIEQVLQETNCGLLLDMAHARVSAATLGWDIYEYLEKLPLHRVVEMHVSGPCHNNGQLVDCHELLRDEDYVILEWLLQRTTPSVVTLEYWKDPDQVSHQLQQLKCLITRVNTWTKECKPTSNGK